MSTPMMPIPDEPQFDEETAQALRDAREGKDLVRYASLEELSDGLGIGRSEP